MRRAAGCLLLAVMLAAASATAQEPPPPTPAPDTPPAVPATPAPPPAEAPPAAKRALLLPVDYTVYEQSAGGVREPVPQWTEHSRESLAAAVTTAVPAATQLEVVPAPAREALSADEAAALDEHVALFNVAAQDAMALIAMGGKPWAGKKQSFDYTVGEGLAFLRERTGADYAIVVNGAQIKQTGGSVFLQILAAGAGIALPGGGTYLVVGMVDLASGRIAWLNSLMGAEVMGMTGSDLRESGAALLAVQKLLAAYPASPYMAAQQR